MKTNCDIIIVFFNSDRKLCKKNISSDVIVFTKKITGYFTLT